MTRRTISARLLRSAAVTLLAVGGLAACGGDGGGSGAEVASLGTDEPADDSTDATTPASTPTDPEEAMLAYTECMRDHGIDMPDPEPVGGGEGGMIALEADPEDATFQDAQAACEHIMEDAVRNIDIDPEEEAEMRQQLLDFSQCMRDHGIDMPDPVFGDNGRVTVNAEGADGERPFDPEDEDFTAASAECSRDGGPFVANATGPSEGSDGQGPTVRIAPGGAPTAGGGG